MEEDKNYINLIRGDLTKASQAHNGMPDSVGMMNIKTANQTPFLKHRYCLRPVRCGTSFWYEGGTLLLVCRFQRGQVHPCRADSRPPSPEPTMCCIWTLNCPKSSSSSAIPTSMESSTPFPTKSIGCLLTATSFWMPTLRKLS